MTRIFLLAMIFVLIRIPCIAQDADLFAGDARLLNKHTIKAAGIPLKELLDQLSNETGVRLIAGSKVADDKVVLYSHDRPLVDSLKIIAKFLNFYWGKTGQAGAHTYTLSQSLRQQKLEEQEIEADYYRAADQIRREVEFVGRHENESKEELLPLLETLRLRMLEEKNAAAFADLTSEHRIVASLIRARNAILAARFLGRLDRDSLVRLLKTSRLEYRWPHETGKNPLPIPVRDEIYRLVAEQSVENKGDTTQFNTASLTIEGSHGQEPRLNGMFTAGSRAGGSVRSSGTGFMFPMDFAYLQNRVDEPIEPENWRSIAALNVPLAVSATRLREDSDESRTSIPPPALAQILGKVEERHSFDVISNAFYGTSPQNLPAANRPLGDVLTAVSRNTSHRWSYADGFVRLRHRRYAAVRAGEPSVYSLRKWATLPPEGLYTLDVLGEMGDQNYPQYQTTLRVLDESRVFGRSNPIGDARGHLIFWNRLNPAQRAAAMSESGLPYRALNRELRELFQLTSLNLLGSEQMRSSNQDKTWPVEALSEATFRIVQTKNEMWGFQTSSGHNAGGGTREQVFERMKRETPALMIDQLRRARSTLIRFEYTGREFGTTGVLNMPLVWSRAETGTTQPNP